MSAAILGLVVMGVAFGVIAGLAARSRELFVLSVRDGQTRLLRGRIPPALHEALGDVMRRAAVRRATLKVLRAEARAQLIANGLEPAVLQRARNVVGTFPLHKLLAVRSSTAPK